ncbi:MAG TPA: putative Se/S carrier-like protein [Longimicrobiales bacterium]
MNPVLVFDTTHHALWAEEIALERGLAVQVIPAPPAAAARCDLALETLPEDVEALTAALAAAGVAFRIYEGSGGPPQ